MKTKIFYSVLLCVVFAFQSHAQWSNKSFTFGSNLRQYRLYVPPSYNPANPAAIVVTLHGLGDNMNNFSGIGMNYIADTANFLVLVPQALVDPLLTSTAWNSGAGLFGYYPNASINDKGFFNAMIDTTMAHYSIDPSRIFMCGFSMGAFMTQRMAVQSNQKFAAFASIAGTIGAGVSPYNPGRPIPVLHFHGTNDSTVPYDNNPYGINTDSLINFWIANNQCNPTPIHTDLPNTVVDGDTVEHFLYQNGLQGSTVEFFKVRGADHEWLWDPHNDIDYTDEIWRFFNKHQHQSLNIPDNVEVKQNFWLFPNPANDFINIEWQQASSNEELRVELFNIQGLLVLTEQVKGTNFRISLMDKKLISGVYLLRIFSSKTHFTQRVIVNR